MYTKIKVLWSCIINAVLYIIISVRNKVTENKAGKKKKHQQKKREKFINSAMTPKRRKIGIKKM